MLMLKDGYQRLNTGAARLAAAYFVFLISFVLVGLLWRVTPTELLQFTISTFGLAIGASMLLIVLGVTRSPGSTVFFGLITALILTITPAGFGALDVVFYVLYVLGAFSSLLLLLLALADVVRRGSNAKQKAGLADAWLIPAVAASLVFAAFSIIYLVQRGIAPRITEPAAFEIARTDALFHEVLANGLAAHGWGESGIVAGVPLRYHTLSYAWLGNIGSVFEYEPFIVQLRIAPLFLALLLAWGASFWAFAVRRSPLDSSLAPILVLLGGLVAAPAFTVIGPDVIRPYSLSSGFSAVVILGASWALTSLYKQNSRLLIPTAALGTFVATGVKTSSAPIIFTVAAALVLTSLRQHRGVLQPLVALLAASLGAGAAHLLLAFGQQDSGLLEINRTWLGALSGNGLEWTIAASSIAVAAMFVMAWIPRFSGVFGLLGTPFRLEP